MKMNEAGDRKAPSKTNLADWEVKPRRPSSWLNESELRNRARRRNSIYLMIAVACMLLFVVLIYLLLERTRWSAGSSTQANVVSAAD